jgi:hypothetical protein
MIIRRFITNNARFAAESLKICKIYKFCDHQKQLQAINIQMLDHNNYLADAHAFTTYFNDNCLLNLVLTSYYLSDLVRIANSLIYHTKKEDFTDAKVLFIAYTSNLYYIEMKGASNSIFTIIVNAL